MMHLYIAEKVQRLDVDTRYFFRMAYQWKFGKVLSLQNAQDDVTKWKQYGITPQYLIDYVRELQKQEQPV